MTASRNSSVSRITGVTGCMVILIIVVLMPTTAAAAPSAAAAPTASASPPAAPTAPTGAAAPSTVAVPLPDASSAIARLDALRRDARDLALPLAARRRAAESLLDGIRDLVAARPSDPRAAIWLADGAEECYVSILPLGGDLDTVLFSLPAHEEWRRVGAAIAIMLDLSQRAEVVAARSISSLSDPGTPLDAERTALLDRLEVIEAPRRIPLLAGVSQALAAIVLDAMPEARRERGRAALARLMPLLDALHGEARWHAAAAALLASGAAGDAEAFATARAAALESAASDRDLVRRTELRAALAEAIRGDLPGALARVRTLASSAGTEERAAAGAPARGVDPDFPRRLAEFEARLRLDAGAPAREWVAPLVAAVASAPPARRIAWRDAMLARLADASASQPGGWHGEPRLDLAAALAMSRVDPAAPPDAASIDASLARARAALDGLDASDPWRASALDLAARLEARRGRYDASIDAFLELAERFPAEPRAAEAIDRAIVMSEALDRSSPPSAVGAGAAEESDGRRRLRRALEIGTALYPDLAPRARWRVALVVLDAERLAAAGAASPESRAALDRAVSSIRPVLAAGVAAAPGDAVSFDALRARLSLALAVVALDSNQPGEALAALEMTAPSAAGADPALRRRLLERRIEALALLDRDLAADPVLSASSGGEERMLLEATASVLLRLAPPLEPGELRPIPRPRAVAVQRLSARLEALVESAPLSPEERMRLRFMEAECLRAAGEARTAARIYEALLADAPDRADLLLGRAECLVADEHSIGRDDLGRASAIYERLIADREFTADPSKRTPSWWLCHLRLLECHRRAGGSPELVASRVEMLRALDPSLGGDRFAPRFLALRPAPPSGASTSPRRDR